MKHCGAVPCEPKGAPVTRAAGHLRRFKKRETLSMATCPSPNLPESGPPSLKYQRLCHDLPGIISFLKNIGGLAHMGTKGTLCRQSLPRG